MTETIELTLTNRLREITRATHDRLDTSIMAANAFADVAGYGRLVQVQWAFHRDIDALYHDAGLAAAFGDLAQSRRLNAIAADLADLGLQPPALSAPPRFPKEARVDVPDAAGWLYVAEGSRLGAPLLRKEAATLGLSDTYGARHLAPAPGGPAAYWRAFTTALDLLRLDAAQLDRAEAGARDAFARVQDLVDAFLVRQQG